MDLPQELVNSIIDAVVDELDLTKDPWIIEGTPAILETLKSCALVTRAFLHPCQAYIFHGITLSDDDPDPTDNEPLTSPGLFSELLKKHPHLASHVRVVYLQGFAAALEQDSEPIEHVLASVKNLRRLDINVLSDPPGHQVMWGTYPQSIRASLRSAFALPHLHHITLWYFNFEDASELQTLLGESTSLKTLVLHSATFSNTESAETLVPSNPPPPRVVLDSLQLYFIAEMVLQALIDSFTVIDITRLRSVYFHNTPMKSLLRMNAPTIQRVNIRAYYPDSFIDQLIDQDALAGTYDLETLGLKVPFLSSLNKIIRSEQGPLNHWKALDALLGVPGTLPALSEVNIYSDNDERHPELLLRASMPALTARGVLRIHGFSPDFSLGR
ncbi:hypothetical protein DFH06DRAFT_261982 [Mycena polygramma]|nr:hypothetical protein DFH06DRAFT_261982 [Mycena polygramma]